MDNKIDLLQVCSTCNIPHDLYYGYAHHAHSENSQLKFLNQQQQEKIKVLELQLEDSKEIQRQLAESNVRRQLAINIEHEIKMDYLFACPKSVQNKLDHKQRHRSLLAKYDLFEIRKWVQDRKLRSKLDRKWQFKHQKDIQTFKQCMYKLKQFSKAAHSTQLDQEDVDYKTCCELVLKANYSTTTIGRIIQDVTKLSDVRQSQQAKKFLYN